MAAFGATTDLVFKINLARSTPMYANFGSSNQSVLKKKRKEKRKKKEKKREKKKKENELPKEEWLIFVFLL